MFHICAKFGVDCSNGVACIASITDKQTNKLTNKHTCQNWKFWRVMKQQSQIANLPKFPVIVLLLSLLISAFYFLSQFRPFSLIFCCFLNKIFIMVIITWISRAMFKSPMVMPSMTSNASKILFHYICGQIWWWLVRNCDQYHMFLPGQIAINYDTKKFCLFNLCDSFIINF